MKRFILISLIITLSLSLNAQVELQLDHRHPKEVSNLIGFNTGFDHRHWVEKESAGGVTTYTNSIREDILAPIQAIHQPVMRFPGGVIANFYHLYPEDFDCSHSEPCVDDFVPGYGLKRNEVITFNNGFGSVGAEHNFEQNNNFQLTNNWIVTFADLIEKYQESGEEVEIVYMANVLSHFKFGNQSAQFNNDIPDRNSTEFQRSLRETQDALRYLIDVRGLNVTKVEMGTELYFQVWRNENEVNVDRFIQLIPIYRDLLDNLGYDHITLGVPFSHTESLNSGADNWSRKLSDRSYHSNHQYDAWILHDYQRMVDRCGVVLGNCSNCNNWVHEECTLYNGNPNILNCEPDNHSPSSDELENVYEKKNEYFSESFNGGLADEYEEILEKLRGLSGKSEAKLWMTEWNQVFDSGCDQWKGINKFFPNTFAHGVNIFEILHSMYEKNAEMDNQFMDIATFHTLSAPNFVYATINAKADVELNATYYPFLLSSVIHEQGLKKIECNPDGNWSDAEINVHAYSMTTPDSIYHSYIYFSNKTNEAQIVDFAAVDFPMELLDVNMRYVSAGALHSSTNGEYIFNSNNVTTTPINAQLATGEFPAIEPYSIPSYSMGYIHLSYKSMTSSLEPTHELAQIEIRPNPIPGILQINMAEASSSGKIKLVNAFGKTVFESQMIEQTKNIDLSQLVGGTYFLIYESETRRFVRKVVKI